MIGRYRVGNLLEDGSLAAAWRCHNQAAGSFSDRSDQVDDARFDQVRRRLEAELFKRINGRQVLKTHRFGVLGEGHLVDHFHLAQLRAGAAMWRLCRASDEATFTEKVLL